MQTDGDGAVDSDDDDGDGEDDLNLKYIMTKIPMKTFKKHDITSCPERCSVEEQ